MVPNDAVPAAGTSHCYSFISPACVLSRSLSTEAKRQVFSGVRSEAGVGRSLP